ncbi:hypothetical protein PoB_002458400 [Plakobranchus ocellatus]|uniref:Uncharacterized protein n=1 Tax=Plakobranchus ocellatus TaxID=259542 RepID=A0AAV3ZW04_9GAST|nr:hypothetical protein PoB_002458400 [Plakobranchus ocellatus]
MPQRLWDKFLIFPDSANTSCKKDKPFTPETALHGHVYIVLGSNTCQYFGCDDGRWDYRVSGRMEGKRQRGRPRINYFDNIKSWTQMDTREIYDVIRERDVWRQMVHEAVRAANVLGSDAG